MYVLSVYMYIYICSDKYFCMLAYIFIQLQQYQIVHSILANLQLVKESKKFLLYFRKDCFLLSPYFKFALSLNTACKVYATLTRNKMDFVTPTAKID